MEATMANLLCRLRDLVTAMTRAEPRRRGDTEGREWMPPVLQSSDLASPYFLAMADRDAGWYLERRLSS
jgi:hypothetical protein